MCGPFSYLFCALVSKWPTILLSLKFIPIYMLRCFIFTVLSSIYFTWMPVVWIAENMEFKCTKASNIQGNGNDSLFSVRRSVFNSHFYNYYNTVQQTHIEMHFYTFRMAHMCEICWPHACYECSKLKQCFRVFSILSYSLCLFHFAYIINLWKRSILRIIKSFRVGAIIFVFLQRR